MNRCEVLCYVQRQAQEQVDELDSLASKTTGPNESINHLLQHRRMFEAPSSDQELPVVLG